MKKNEKIKEYLSLFLKIAFAAAIFWWLISDDKLDLKKLSILYSKPVLTLQIFFLWFFCFVCLQSVRWFLLLKVINLPITLKEIFKLQSISFFFNAAMPGAVSGDLIKAYYIIRDKAQNYKTFILFSVVLDRIIGMFGLFSLATIITCLGFLNPSSQQNFSYFSYLSLAIWFGILLILMIIFSKTDFLAKIPVLNKLLVSNKLLNRLHTSYRFYAGQKFILFMTTFLGFIIQFFSLVLFILITKEFIKTDFSILNVATIFPFGILTTVLPLTPSGLGVGHAAFDKLFQIIGLHDGANIFNIFSVSLYVLNLSCVVVYILNKKKIKTAVDMATDEQGVERS